MGNIQAYARQVEEWKRKYGTSARSPGDIKLFHGIKCAKCKRKRKLQRHHMGHEYIWATIQPDFYAKRYIEFRDADICRLCDMCHLAIHQKYERILAQMWPLLYDSVNNTLSPFVCEKFRKKLVRTCKRWLSHTQRRKQRSKE